MVGGAGDYTTSQNEIQSEDSTYIKHIVVNNIVTESYVCAFIDNTEYCLRGGVDECQWDSNTGNGNGACTYNGVSTVYNSNIPILQSVFSAIHMYSG